LLVGEHDRVARVDHRLRHRDAVDRELAQPDLARHAVPGLVIAGLGEDHQAIAQVDLRGLHEDAVLQVDRTEHAGVHKEHLRPPQEEEARVVEREVETGEDLALGLEVEVHEGVAAHEQVETRDRRVLDQVQVPEDNRLAQLLAEDVAGRRTLEVPVAEVGGDGLEILGAVASLTGLRDRVLVDVGGVDLDALVERVCAEHFRQRHREAVRLLAAGTPGAPDTDGLRVGLGGQQLREDLGAKVFPRGGVAKEARDVDQDGVEEVGELPGMGLEVFEVVAVPLQVEHLGSLAHAPREARPLVPGEVESAAAPQMLEQRLERPAVFHVLHCTCPFISVTSAHAISSRGRTKSTLPLSMAAPGMPKNSDVCWSWAMTVPPIFLMALTPIEPSPPLPESTTAIARSLQLAATDSN